MCLSNRDIKWAIDCGKLIVEPRPEGCEPPKGYDETAIDLHLGPIETARVWDLESLSKSDVARGAAQEGQAPHVYLGTFEYKAMAEGQLKPIPMGEKDGKDRSRLVYRRDDDIIVKQLGFLLWTTNERVGTP